ncbi:MAG: Beta-glucosidase BoGH3B [Burkholderia plantarii]|nr:MAG: Beta-glucosidase BoGH3B [Burkholderia plantarii]
MTASTHRFATSSQSATSTLPALPDAPLVRRVVCHHNGVAQPLSSVSAPWLHVDGLVFKDLAGDGILHPYLDWRLAPDLRARDLLSRLTLEQKAGAMLHATAPAAGPAGVPGAGQSWDFATFEHWIRTRHVRAFLSRLRAAPVEQAGQANRAQAIAERSPLGIPLFISTDPRHHFDAQAGTGTAASGFSTWPDAVGLAATGDPAITRGHADTVRRDYLAVGIRMALSPQADLATEPRWSRIRGTFGDDPRVARAHVQAFVEGLQGAHVPPSQRVAAVVKHWVGYGAAIDGYDAHSYYGRFIALSPEHLDQHIEPFLGAFDAGVAGVMPTYGMPAEALRLPGLDQPVEAVGAGFSRALLSGLLRGRYGFGGLVLSDWAIMNDCDEVCRLGAPPGAAVSAAHIAMPWGVDQFGGIDDPAPLLAAIEAGAIDLARVDASVQRILELSFRLGLFEDPYVDTLATAEAAGSHASVAEAEAAQAASLVLLENHDALLPLAQPPSRARDGWRVVLHGIDPDAAARAGFVVVSEADEADVALVRIAAPYEQPHANYFFGARFHEGSLAFDAAHPDRLRVAALSARVPTVVVIGLDRPAVLDGVHEQASALIAHFGVSDAVLLDVLAGRRAPLGRLPFSLPAAMHDVQAKPADQRLDPARARYAAGYGLAYLGQDRNPDRNHSAPDNVSRPR